MQLTKNSLDNDFDWLREVIQHRLSYHFNGESVLKSLGEMGAPELSHGDSPYADFILQHKLGLEERVILALALVPHVIPHFLDDVIQVNLGKTGEFPQLGGVRGKSYRGFIPTGETALFLLAGNDLNQRFQVLQLFNEDHFFARKQILWIEEPDNGEPRMSGRIILTQDHVDLFTQGVVSSPRFGMNFPAQRINTLMEWDDLVLNEQTMLQIRELEIWVKHGKTLLMDWGMNKKLRPGYRALFHGPPGTGKTLTATLLGKYTGKEVYKIDLSMVISKYIGETEKNLCNLFDRAANKDWILFFDEADALFGKRTSVKDAHDKYANQEVSYLLQRTEDYPGLVILASNFKSNIDESFTRRFQSFIYFPLPKASERLELWKKAFPEKISFDNDVNLSKLAQQFELSGADIMNIVQHVCLNALSTNNFKISNNDILNSIQREFVKSGKIC